LPSGADSWTGFEVIEAVAVIGVMRAAIEAAARRGEMELATSRGVVPEGTSRMEPSGRWMAMVFELMGWVPWRPRDEKTAANT